MAKKLVTYASFPTFPIFFMVFEMNKPESDFFLQIETKPNINSPLNAPGKMQQKCRRFHTAEK
jgi:hypothetical protein